MLQSPKGLQRAWLESEVAAMLLCDIGNTSYHFYDLQNDYKESVECFDPSSIEEEVFYICVHPLLKERLKTLPNWHDLEETVDRSRYYDTMGIDRIMACEAIDNGVIVDAGSAITIDVVKEGVFQGGFIYPGLKAFERAYASISEALSYELGNDIDLSHLPKNTPDALTYGFLSGLVKEINSHNLDIILTGGDAALLKRHIPNAKSEPLLLFKGMLSVIG